MRTQTALGRLAAALLLLTPAFGQLPDGFVDEPFLAGLDGPVGLAFDAGGRGYLWERGGRVYVVENGAIVQPPLLDISDEVGNWRDFGLLGFALDPGFLANGLFYTYYVVDRHHLLHAGTPQYDPSANEYFNATIGRITRFTADAATGFRTTLPGSRFVLLGETPDSGVPILFESHGTGSLVMGSDGTLIASSGDGSNYGPVDNGSSPGTYWQQALADGIIRPEENVGAFRSQMIGSLSGKLLRLDPMTGEGVPSNPFFDPRHPRAHRSLVWGLGLRNPFRFSRRPGSGSLDPSLGDPGVFFVGDVGWNRWEDLQVVQGPGENLGWPLFEGLTRLPEYNNNDTFNLDAPNPLYGQAGCDQPYFTFRDLLKQEKPNHNPRFPNPCDPDVQIAPSTPTFMHTRPALEWRHGQNLARVPIFDGPSAETSTLGEPGCPVEGQPFGGFCAVGGTWLSSPNFGDFSGLFLQMDFSGNWMRALHFHDDNELHEVLEFGLLDSPVFAIEDPGDGSVLYVTLDSNQVRRLRFTGSGAVAPQPVLASTLGEWHGLVTARFDATSSIDPEGGPLSFLWDFGDGASSDEPSPRHLFLNPGGAPTARSVRLSVTDEDQLSNEATTLVQLDNTPPAVQITSFADGASYSTSQNSTLDLVAAVSDAEQATSELAYAWRVFLHHDNHEHPEEVISDATASVVLTPTPCNGSFYAYRVELTVTDPLGAATTVRHWLLPDCQVGVDVQMSAPSVSEHLVPGLPTQLAAQVSGLASRVDFHVDGVAVATLFSAPWQTSWTPPAAGRFTATALAHTPAGTTASSLGLALDVAAPVRLETAVARLTDDAVEDSAGHVQLAGQTLALGAGRTTGLRFELDVPRGATIVSARLELTADAASEVDTFLRISAEASDDAARLTGQPLGLSGRARGAVRVPWSLEPWRYALASGERQRTPELKSLVQELVDRPGWNTGNRVLLLLEGRGERFVRARQGPTSRSARLVVEFDLGG